jgi:hydroxymethylbilane synthase
VSALRIGTRRSKLAVVQAELIRDALATTGVEAEIVPMSTSGDEGTATANAPQGLKGLWIDTILDALESDHIDIAVHSAKDLPAEDDEGFVVAAVPERADPLDLLITRDQTFPSGGVIGTSSLRRRAQLLAAFPGLRIVDLHGNVDTRLRKLDEGAVDAAVLAAAGLARLGITPAFAKALPITQMVPAPGQGCLAVQCRDDDEETMAAVAPLDHADSHTAFDTERSLMWRLGGGCALPLGAFAELDSGGRIVHLVAVIATVDGDQVIRVEEQGTDPEVVAAAAAKALIAAGAEEILAEVRSA